MSDINGPALRLAIARAIADEIGPSYDMAFKHKGEWIDARGVRDGVSLDVNAPFKSDYLAAADAVLEALAPHLVPAGCVVVPETLPDAWIERIWRAGLCVNCVRKDCKRGGCAFADCPLPRYVPAVVRAEHAAMVAAAKEQGR